MALVCYILAVLGLAYVVGKSRVSLPLRKVLAGFLFVRASSCPACKQTEFPPTRRPVSDFSPPDLFCHVCRVVYRADWYVYILKWPILLVECPACLATWVGALVAWRLPALALQVAPGFSGVVPFALLSCGGVAAVSFLVGLQGD